MCLRADLRGREVLPLGSVKNRMFFPKPTGMYSRRSQTGFAARQADYCDDQDESRLAQGWREGRHARRRVAGSEARACRAADRGDVAECARPLERRRAEAGASRGDAREVAKRKESPSIRSPRRRRYRVRITGSTAVRTSITSSLCAKRAAPKCRRASGRIRSCTRADQMLSSARPTTCRCRARNGVSISKQRSR